MVAVEQIFDDEVEGGVFLPRNEGFNGMNASVAIENDRDIESTRNEDGIRTIVVVLE